jgi:hypothetical protein
MYPLCCGIVGQCNERPRSAMGSRLCEKSHEPRKRRIVFSIAVSRPRLPVQLVSVSMKLRLIFYTQIERRTFHTAWVKNGSVQARAARPFYPQEQTSSACPGMSVWCHIRTYAPQQSCRYSITSSARAMIAGGIATPSVLAVLRLIASSNFSG